MQIGNLRGKAIHQNLGIQSKNKDFKSHLQTAIMDSSLKISKHAEHRLEERNITINENQWKKIEEKISQAKSMGVSNSLVLMDHAALIISAKNNTVVTAMDLHEAESQIFTNINGTILLHE